MPKSWKRVEMRRFGSLELKVVAGGSALPREEKGVSTWKKIAGILIPIVVMAGGMSYYFLVYQSHQAAKELEERIKTLEEKVGYARSEAIEFNNIQGYRAQALDDDGITFARMWKENAEMADRLHEIEGSFSETVHGDPDLDEIKSSDEMLFLGTNPLYTNYILRYAVREGFDLDIVKELIPLEAENPRLVSRDVKENFIDQLFMLDPELQKDFAAQAMKKKTLIPVDREGSIPGTEIRELEEIMDVQGGIDQIKFLLELKRSKREIYDEILRENLVFNYDMDKPMPDNMHNYFEWLNREENGGLYNPFVTNERYFVSVTMGDLSNLFETTKFFELLKFSPQNVTIYQGGLETGMPTVKNLLKTLSEIAKKADNNDFLFLHLGGHNYVGTRPHSFGVRLVDGGATYKYDINPHLDNIKANAKVLFIDTCASGYALPYNTSKNTIFLTQVLYETGLGDTLLERAMQSVVGGSGLSPLRKYVSMIDVLEYTRAHPRYSGGLINAQISDPFGLAKNVCFGDFKSSI